MRTRFAPILALLTAVLTVERVSAQTTSSPSSGGLATPAAIRTEHQQLRDRLARASAEAGAVGDAARSIERILIPHLKHEEASVLPPLGLLRGLVEGDEVRDAKAVIALVDEVERGMPERLKEHRAILEGVKRLQDACQREGKREYLSLADQLWTHAVLEDQVLYPATILVARYLSSKQGLRPRASGQPHQP
jgi:hypothetical protein